MHRRCTGLAPVVSVILVVFRFQHTQIITFSGITASDTPIVDVVLSSTAATAISQQDEWGCISKITTAANSITVTCLEEKPTINIPIRLIAIR